MNITLVNPTLFIDSDVSTTMETRFFPEGLAEIARVLINAGHHVHVIDMCAGQELTPEVCVGVHVFGVLG